jgi:hypothetical protein
VIDGVTSTGTNEGEIGGDEGRVFDGIIEGVDDGREEVGTDGKMCVCNNCDEVGK